MRNSIQLVVVLLILLSCGGILTIVVIKAREAADRMGCTNNLKQLGLAIRNYHESHNQFPKAALPNPELPPEGRQSWIVEIWPFVEAGPLYSRIDHKKAWDAEENRFAALTILRTLQCPAHRERPPDSAFFSSHYLGIAGLGVDAIDLSLEDSRAGFFGYDRTLRLKDLKDRADSLLMIAETSKARGAWTAAGPPTSRGLDPSRSPYLGVDGQFGGNHPSGANVVFADGSVRLIEKTIDPAVCEAMATLSGKGNSE